MRRLTRVLVVVSVLAPLGGVQAQLHYEESFPYAADSDLTPTPGVDDPWEDRGDNDFRALAPGLTYPGVASSGQRGEFVTTISPDAQMRDFDSGITAAFDKTSGQTFVAFLGKGQATAVEVNGRPTPTSGPFSCCKFEFGSNTNGDLRLRLRGSLFGEQNFTGATVNNGTDTVLYGARVTFAAGADEIRILANPSDPNNPDWSSASIVASNEELTTDENNFVQFQPVFSNTSIDEFRIADTWECAIGAGACAAPPADLDGTWTRDGIGLWTDQSNWDIDPAPTTSQHTATFANAISAPTTVVVDTDVTINTITFNHSISYGVGGLGSINLHSNTTTMASPAINVEQGDHQFQVVTNLRDDTTVDVASDSTLSFNNVLDLNGQTLTKTGDGTLSINNVLNSGGGTILGLAGTISGSGTVGGDVNNQGGTISPGSSSIHADAAAQVPEPAGLLLLVAGCVSGLLCGRQLHKWAPVRGAR